MQSGKINVNTENIFPIIKKFLYSDHEIFLRELISNASDAIDRLLATCWRRLKFDPLARIVPTEN
jgi:molecular chaperone HtpG